MSTPTDPTQTETHLSEFLRSVTELRDTEFADLHYCLVVGNPKTHKVGMAHCFEHHKHLAHLLTAVLQQIDADGDYP